MNIFKLLKKFLPPSRPSPTEEGAQGKTFPPWGKRERGSSGIKQSVTYLIFVLFIIVLIPVNSSAQQTTDVDPKLLEAQQDVAPVKLDGKTLFNVRGISSYPAKLRATTISKRIQKAASDTSISIDSVKIIPSEERTMIYAGKEFIMSVYNADALKEGIDRTILSSIIHDKIVQAVNLFRYDRTPSVLFKKSLYALGAIVLFSLILLIFRWIFRLLNRALENRIRKRVESVEDRSFKLIRSDRLWFLINQLVKIIRFLIIFILSASLILYLLDLFPWTKSIRVFITDIFINPLRTFGLGIYTFLPSLAFLIIIFLATRYILKLVDLLTSGVANGTMVIKNFDAEWAKPTARILRICIIAFAVVVSYPYIPGSGTNAFKGISVFIGLIFSLGSSSFIGNLIAGYSMTYRRAFKKGDLIKAGEHIGFVEEQQILVTRLRSFKNEEIVIPSSVLLNSNILNYSRRSKESGVILHTKVGIGYETPWRQVDAMLMLAAERTEGLLKEPAPFVLKESLGDFAVNYEINAYCHDTSNILFIYNSLHQNILDVFNENDVQIMTPAYMKDPEAPKVVPKDKWDIPLKSD
jgi:small-conductance mechanosensitive channel